MPTATIRSNRSTVGREAPWLGFTVRTGRQPFFEVALATDPRLFEPEARSNRTSANFWSSRHLGPLSAQRGEAVFIVPQNVLRRFVGRDRLFYTVATFADSSRAHPEILLLPPEITPSVSISKSYTGRVPRSQLGSPSTRAVESYEGDSGTLEWAGDESRPGGIRVGQPSSDRPAPTDGSGGNGPTSSPVPAASAAQFEYDDGFDPALWSRPRKDGVAAVPLDPSNGGRTIGSESLALADIILVTTSLDAATNGDGPPASRAMLYLGDGVVLDDSHGSARPAPLATVVSVAPVAVALRHASITVQQAARVRDFAAAQIGRTWRRTARVGEAAFRLDSPSYCGKRSDAERARCEEWSGPLHLGSAAPNQFLCPEIILAAFREAGLALADPEPSWRADDEIVDIRLTSPLRYVGHLRFSPASIEAGDGAPSAAESLSDRDGNVAQAPSPTEADPSSGFRLSEPPAPTEAPVSVAAGRAAESRRRAPSRSMQVVEIASAVVGATMTRILDNEGDVTWSLDQLDGAQHPDGADKTPSREAYRTTRIEVPGLWVENLARDRITADFEVTFQHNGASVGFVQVTPIRTNDAAGWGLDVKETIMHDPNTYTTVPPSAARFAALTMRFAFRFTRVVGEDQLGVIDLTLFGNGTHRRESRWTQ